nr:MAG: hypothetical protein DIU78_08060 [Pseudomonadota bacterium]
MLVLGEAVSAAVSAVGERPLLGPAGAASPCGSAGDGARVGEQATTAIANVETSLLIDPSRACLVPRAQRSCYFASRGLRGLDSAMARARNFGDPARRAGV